MAPDLNSVPPSPRPLASSPRLTRPTSQQVAPPAGPTSPPLNILPSNQNTVAHLSPPLASPNMTATSTTGDNTGVGTGPGPLRHPRPLTAADLHLQLEKEQEAVVNRLTRELTMLRAAQNASVVSNTSSTSAGFPDPADHNANHLLSGPSHPAPSQRRHHRSSSSTSTRSNTAISSLTGLANAPSTTADRTRGSLPRHDSNTQPQSISLSRQNSMTGSRRSGASSPALLSSAQSSYQPHPGEHFPSYYTSRPIPHRDPSSSSLAMVNSGSYGGSEMTRQDSVTSVQTTGRYEEAAFHRHELEAVKRENDALKRRIRDLERTLRTRRQSDASATAGGDNRMRSESVSTTASIRERDPGASATRGRERVDRDTGGEEEAVQVGESARSAGI